MTLESRYRRLLRWYPAAWLARDHDVLLGTLLDAAEASGRRRPSATEAGSIALHGLAERADRRAGIVAAAIATALSAVATAVFFTSTDLGGLTSGGWSIPALLVAEPPLLLIGGVALLRGGGLIGARTTVALPMAALVAGLAGATRFTLWDLSFDAADEGRTLPEGAGTAALAAFGTAWLLVGVIIAVVMLAVLRPAGESVAFRLIPAVVVGVVGAPALGIAFVQPGGPFVCSGGVLAASLVLGRPRTERPSPPPALARSRRRADPVAFTLAAAGTAASFAAAAFCFIGGPLGVFGLDGTGAMGAGLGLGAVMGLPVLAAAARSTEPAPPRIVVLLAAAGLVVNAAARLPGPFSVADGSIGPLVVSGTLLAAAAARIVHTRLPGTPRTRVVLAALIGAGLLAGGGIVIAGLLGFLVPIAGIAVLVRSRRPKPSGAVALA